MRVTMTTKTSKTPLHVVVQKIQSTARITELTDRFPQFKSPLVAINERIVDLLPVARRHYYHPAQQGSWSLKSVLPTIATDLSYDKLDGVQDGSMAMTAYLEAVHPQTAAARKEEIRRQLLDYCSLDTYALVRLWQHFTGWNDACKLAEPSPQFLVKADGV